MQNMKQQAKEIEDFYKSSPNYDERSKVHVLKSKQGFVQAFNGELVNPKWFDKVRESV